MQITRGKAATGHLLVWRKIQFCEAKTYLEKKKKEEMAQALSFVNVHLKH